MAFPIVSSSSVRFLQFVVLSALPVALLVVCKRRKKPAQRVVPMQVASDIGPMDASKENKPKSQKKKKSSRKEQSGREDSKRSEKADVSKSKSKREILKKGGKSSDMKDEAKEKDTIGKEEDKVCKKEDIKKKIKSDKLGKPKKDYDVQAGFEEDDKKGVVNASSGKEEKVSDVQKSENVKEPTAEKDKKPADEEDKKPAEQKDKKPAEQKDKKLDEDGYKDDAEDDAEDKPEAPKEDNKVAADAKEDSKLDVQKTQAIPVPDVAIELCTEPKELRFTSAGGFVDLNLTNNTGTRLAIKVKCSDNSIYRINPVFKVVEKGGKLVVEVSRAPGAAKPDKLAVVYTEAADGETDAQSVFKATPTDKQLTANVPLQVS